MKPAVLFLLLFVFFSGTGLAQTTPSGEDSETAYSTDPRVGSYYQFFPLAGYTSDWGFFGGGFMHRINYGVHVFPFLSNTKVDVIFSTNGTISSQLEYERIRTFGLPVRSRIIFVGERERRGHYFGIGNDAVFSGELYDEGHFYYENRQFYLGYQARKQIATFAEEGEADAFIKLSFSRVNGLPRGESSLFEQQTPPGYGKNSLMKAGLGVVSDSRDSEFSPTKGIRYEAGLNTSLPFFGNDFSYSDIRLEMRHYVELFDGLVLAHKFQLEHILGRAPFWDLSVLGTQKGLRGFHLDRFRGNSSVLNMLELRVWLFSLFDDQVRLGGQAFWDSGRVFTDRDSDGFFSGWKQTAGLGGVMSLFNPDFFVRGEIGFSSEAYRIYFGTGYTF